MQQKRVRLDSVKRAVWLRERGRIAQAVALFDQVIATCKEQGDWINLADALAERIISWKHYFQNLRGGDRDKFLQLIQADAEAGLRLNVPAENRAPFHLRLGDYYTFRGDMVLAERGYRKAYELALGTPEACEYKAHWAESLLALGRSYTAYICVRNALVLAYQHKSHYERWHWLIVLSGILSRQVKIDRANGDVQGAIKTFAKSYVIAWILLVWYWKPQRWRQYHQAILAELSKLIRRR